MDDEQFELLREELTALREEVGLLRERIERLEAAAFREGPTDWCAYEIVPPCRPEDQ